MRLDKTLKALGLFQLAGMIGMAVLMFGKGRPEANAHPDMRGGGDWGFGGTS